MPDTITLSPTSLPDLPIFLGYAASLSAPIESFLEDTMLESAAYAITMQDKIVGCCAARGATLTLFFLDESVRGEGWAIWDHVVAETGVTAALVPTCDGFMLGHALHSHTKVEVQALFYEGQTPTTPPPNAPNVRYRPATLDDLPALSALNEDILDDRAARVGAGQVHVGFMGDAMVAVGLIIPSQVWASQASLGMFTAGNVRRQGVGTASIRYMMQVCAKRGITPLAGCPYGHMASRATLQAAGMVPGARLLKIAL